MKPPIQPAEDHNDRDAEILREHYLRLPEKQKVVETRRNLLLTPFLLSIPVIIILFILISESTADFTSTVNAEPLNQETIITPIKQAEPVDRSVIAADSLVKGSALQAKK